MRYDKIYLLFGLAYAVVGMSLGILMAASHNHGQHVTHAHILLLGFLVSLVYAIIHKLWLPAPLPWLATLQLVLHQLAALVMAIGLGLLYGAFMPPEKVEPWLSASAFGALAATVLMILMVAIAKDTSVASGRT